MWKSWWKPRAAPDRNCKRPGLIDQRRAVRPWRRPNIVKEIFVNLKRFEVPRSKGGLCPMDDPLSWIETVIETSLQRGLGRQEALKLVYLLPEGLLSTADRALRSHKAAHRKNLSIGCQGVHWQDIQPGGNFGAFTGSLPATSAAVLGSTWALIGHSEERRAKRQVLEAYDPRVAADDEAAARANRAVDSLVQEEVQAALQAGLDVLLCVGEAAAERGDGPFSDQKPRIEGVLRAQLLDNLRGAGAYLKQRRVVIGYEPIWAIGPGKTPPGPDYIGFVSSYIKGVVRQALGFDPVVVYGGGLKEENAAAIAAVDTIGGGLVALTRFSGDIGFEVEGLQDIVQRVLEV